ncbi:hypothetical protein NPIL_40211 [Nephila pilipes]|uniref:Uncharacterized protein n=1 Tax=Nephila pilipes TaxID=299642 RepID=A0A8X6Q2M4_NEPPI|nr:hypothetical protein NPIL_40211 [Nephila pilipes]
MVTVFLQRLEKSPLEIVTTKQDQSSRNGPGGLEEKLFLILLRRTTDGIIQADRGTLFERIKGEESGINEAKALVKKALKSHNSLKRNVERK